MLLVCRIRGEFTGGGALGFGMEQRVNQGNAIDPETPMPNTDPRDDYVARTAQIRGKLARLRQLAADHFGQDSAAVHWGHVGDLGRVGKALDDLIRLRRSARVMDAGPTAGIRTRCATQSWDCCASALV